MTVLQKMGGTPAMASPWRRRRLCSVKWNQLVPAALHDVNGKAAILKTGARPPLGSSVELRHPEAGSISGIVSELAADGFTMRFDCSELSISFALAAITADMSDPL